MHFLITSAIMSKHGAFSVEERFNQTIDTIDSIKKYAPGSSISLIESSVVPLNVEKYQSHLNLLVDEYIDFTRDETVISITKQWSNQHIVKNVTESHVLSQVLNNFKTEHNRIFKISGRYVLTDQFKLIEQDVLDPVVVFRDKWPNNWPEGMCDIPFQYPITGLSFSSKLIEFMQDVYTKSYFEILKHVNKQQYCDLEHALYKFIPEEKIKLIKVTTVRGLRATDGQKN
jgi:hypothetical protein